MSLHFLPKVVILDFEMAPINAFRKFFIDIDVKLCHFHWAQAVFRIIASEGLKPPYGGFDNKTGSWLKQFFGLPLLPPDEVENAFVFDLMPQADSDPKVEKSPTTCWIHTSLKIAGIHQKCGQESPLDPPTQRQQMVRKLFIGILRNFSNRHIRTYLRFRLSYFRCKKRLA